MVSRLQPASVLGYRGFPTPSLSASLQTGLTPQIAFGSSTLTFARASTAYVPGYGPAGAVTDPPMAQLLDAGEAGFWGARRISANNWSMYDANGILLVPANGASTGLCDQFGNFGYFAGGARSDVLGTTNAIRRTMTDVGWVSGGGGITVGAATGFDGVGNAGASLTAGGANGTLLFTTVLGAAVRTYSAWVRRKTGTGTVQITKDGGSTWTTIALTANYPVVPFQVTTTSAANPVVGFRIVTSGDAIEVDFNTLEQAAIANPTPIPVNVSKAADVLTCPSAGNVSGTVGTAYAEWTTAETGTANERAVLGGSNAIFETLTGAGTPLGTYLSGANKSFALNTTLPITSPAKGALAWNATASNASLAGVAGTPAAGGSLDLSNNIIVIGDVQPGNRTLFGTIRNVRIYPVALSLERLTSLTR